MKIKKYIKYKFRGFILAIESRFGGKKETGILPNGVMVYLNKGHISKISAHELFQTEIQSYWNEHQPKPGEIHLDVGAQIGSYTLMAASSGAIVYSLEPDSNNRRFLTRNLNINNLKANIIKYGAWNKKDTLAFRSHDAISSIKGVSEVASTHPALDRIVVNTIDNLVNELGINRIDVIKMDIEGAEIEAIEGAEKTIKLHRPVLMIEAYHIRNGEKTLKSAVSLLNKHGIPNENIICANQDLIIAKGY
jgi:FkbM family methyltransferase